MKKESRSAHPAKKPSVVSELRKQQPRPQEPALVRSGNLQAEIDTRHAPRWHSLHNLASEGLSGQLDVHGLPLFTLVTASGRISSTECTTGKTTQGDTSSLRMSLSCPHGIETAFQIHAPAGSAQGYLRLAVEVWAAEVSSVQRLKGCRGSAPERCLISAATSTSIVLHHTEVLILEVRLAHQLPAA
mmetsp:Transcript_73817/g.128036  ORF Transcript_73817/g.128036 Transcript_73817/m.128036 type:complete len:187 (-) Transcript_73817:41-601(-)